MNNNEQQLKDRVQNAYENEALNIPDIDAAWRQFEPLYFKKKKRRFLLFYIGFTCVLTLLLILNSFSISKLYHITPLRHLTLHHISEQQQLGHISFGDTGKRRKDANPNSFSKTTHQFKLKDFITNIQGYDLLNNYRKSLQIQAEEILIPKPASNPLVFSEQNDTLNILAANKTPHLNVADIPLLSGDSTGELNDSVGNDSVIKKQVQQVTKPKPKNSRFSIHFINQISSAHRSKLFNPEFAWQYQRETRKLTFQTGLGIGLNHFNQYEFSQLNLQVDSQRGDYTKDSIVGQLKSSFYFFIPVNIGIPVFKNLKFHLGADLLFHASNTFEKTTYITQNSFIRPSSVDSVITNQTTIEKHNKFSPSLRLTWDMSYRITHFDLVFGVRKTLYNGLQALNLPGGNISKSKLNFALGLVYHF